MTDCALCEEPIDVEGGVLLGHPFCVYCAGVAWRVLTEPEPSSAPGGQ